MRWAQQSSTNLSLHYAPIVRSDAAQRAHRRACGCVGLRVRDTGRSRMISRISLVVSASRMLVAERFGSPFDFERQALLYLPRCYGCAFVAATYAAGGRSSAARVLAASGGLARSCCYRAIARCVMLLSFASTSRLPRPSYPILIKGTAPRDLLLTRFRELGNAVLLGTSSFWEGVDVKGAALSVVVIDKLPFAVPDDPVLKARLAAIEREGGNAFLRGASAASCHYAEAGRRSVDSRSRRFRCRHAVRSTACVRAATAASFLDSLPPMRRTDQLPQVCAFLTARLAEVSIVVAQPSLAAEARLGLLTMNLLAIDTATERCSVAAACRRPGGSSGVSARSAVMRTSSCRWWRMTS